MTDRAEIEIKNLATGYAQRRKVKKILHQNIDINLSAGELICILGPNGVGKSTLIKTLLGFETPLAGEIYINKENLRTLSVRDLAQIISVVLTDKIDDIYLTAREIINTGRYPYGNFSGKLNPDDLKQIKMAEQAVGVSQHGEKVFAKLSDGEKQKVMIARAIAQNTPFIFLDEPVAFLDAPSRISIMQMLFNLTREMEKGILMATHDMDSALKYADVVWLLGEEGNWKSGNPEELVKSGTINQFFDTDEVTYSQIERRFNWSKK
jgi:iron complex transport system ATP-binding protein